MTGEGKGAVPARAGGGRVGAEGLGGDRGVDRRTVFWLPGELY